ncbi:MAG TPA: alpha/beta hydrolase [Anaeromyxobacteraceae bacterium]|nr:alpha/beta hydrolase [Anaeromyxobacteraceae bacterium]
MVLPGQYLERPALVSAGDVTLEALYHRGRRPPGLLVCPALDGEGMDAPLLAEIAWAAAREGHASLRFQHRGRGASQGAFDPSTLVVDALAALLHLRETAGPVAAVVGLGTGCGAAVEAAARGGVRRVVLAAPATLPVVPAGVDVLALLPELGSPLGVDAVAMALSGGGGRVEVVEGADPAFRAGMSRAAARAVAWVSALGVREA